MDIVPCWGLAAASLDRRGDGPARRVPGPGLARPRQVVWNGALTIVVILALAVARARQEPQRLAWLALALGLSAASLLVQRTSVSLGPFNHNDVCHVLLTVALWPFYGIGLGLRDHGGPIGGRWPASPSW